MESINLVEGELDYREFDARKFAQRVLLARSLEEKLAKPRAGELRRSLAAEAEFTSLLKGMECPERPVGLEFKAHRAQGAKMPHSAELINEDSRARLLHFFCNHELLAVELMALALLKFPDAPLAFRQELLGTLLEEQLHTRWYLERMKQLGLEFGSQPLSGMIWKAIAPMESPLDYVSRLSLTFEQANLDYALFYHRLFKQAGDGDSAAILGKIYRDEISHVGTGAHWLRKWKRKDEDDFTCWARQLRKPLSPIRARGNLDFFNVQGRRKAGLGEEFIEQVRLAAGTRGRQPDIWRFDALAELRWAGVETAPRFEKLSNACESVLFCFAHTEDWVVQKQQPSDSLRAKWADKGFIFPRVIKEEELAEALKRGQESIHQEHHWAPQLSSCPESWRMLYDKLSGVRWLREFCLKKGMEFDPAWDLQVYESRAELAELEQGQEFKALVFKAPFGAGGQGLRRLEKPADWQRHRRWLEKVLREQGRVLVAPWLKIVHEGSAQFEVDEGGALRWRALVWTKCSRGGKFQSALSSAHPLRLPFLCQRVKRFFNETSQQGPSPYEWLRECLPELLEPQLAKLGYQGALGVDFLIYEKARANGENGKNGETDLCFHPLNDLNARRSFGRAAWELWTKLQRPQWLELSLSELEPERAGWTEQEEGVSCLPLAEGDGMKPWAMWSL